MKKGFYEERISRIKNIQNKSESRNQSLFGSLQYRKSPFFPLPLHLNALNWMRSLKSNKCLRNKKFKELLLRGRTRQAEYLLQFLVSYEILSVQKKKTQTRMKLLVWDGEA